MRTLIALAMLAVLGAVAVPVAAGAEGAVRANIPFEFAVGGVTLPAGTYQFETHNPGRALGIWSAQERTWTLVLANPAYPRKPADSAAKVVFNRYGDRYFLSEVWGVGATVGKRILKTRQEREASLKASTQTVQVAAN